jgi:hypothetical protein
MSDPACSVFVFGLYLLVLAIVLLVAPNFLLEMFFLPSTSEVWIRVIGMLVLFLGFFYAQGCIYDLGDTTTEGKKVSKRPLTQAKRK